MQHRFMLLFTSSEKQDVMTSSEVQSLMYLRYFLQCISQPRQPRAELPFAVSVLKI